MPKADVSEERIVISECGQRSADWWNTLLDKLKAHRTICGGSSTRLRFHGVDFTHSVIPTRRSFSILEQRRRWFSGNYDTPTLARPLRFTATSLGLPLSEKQMPRFVGNIDS
jgi:hypothetical protein